MVGGMGIQWIYIYIYTYIYIHTLIHIMGYTTNSMFYRPQTWLGNPPLCELCELCLAPATN